MRVRIEWALIAALWLAGCEDDKDRPSSVLDAGTLLDVPTGARDAQADSALPPDCSPNPQTYLEIINACTDAEKVTKTPVLPLRGADGSLPPLP